MSLVNFQGEKLSVILVGVKKLFHIVETLLDEILLKHAFFAHAVRTSCKPKTMGIFDRHVVVVATEGMH